MAMRIEKVVSVNAGSAAQEIDIGFRPFLIANTDQSSTVYFKEKAEDGTDCTAANGFPVAAGAMLDKVLTAQTLSVYGGTASVLILREA